LSVGVDLLRKRQPVEVLDGHADDDAQQGGGSGRDALYGWNLARRIRLRHSPRHGPVRAGYDCRRYLGRGRRARYGWRVASAVSDGAAGHQRNRQRYAVAAYRWRRRASVEP